jgi:hypothetical protein
MKQLSKEFDGRGEVKQHRFVQLAANDLGYIYEVYPPEGRSYFEVFKKKENTQFDCVSYPSSNAFGTWAWTTPSASRARRIFEGFTPPLPR